MSSINGISSNILNLQTASSQITAATTSTSNNSILKTASSQLTASTSSLDSYLSSAQSASLAGYLSDDASGNSGLYSVLTYSQTGQVNLIYDKMQDINNANSSSANADTTAATSKTSL